MHAVRKNRYVILPKDFEKGYRTNVKKPETDFDFYKWAVNCFLASLMLFFKFVRQEEYMWCNVVSFTASLVRPFYLVCDFHWPA